MKSLKYNVRYNANPSRVEMSNSDGPVIWIYKMDIVNDIFTIEVINSLNNSIKLTVPSHCIPSLIKALYLLHKEGK